MGESWSCVGENVKMVCDWFVLIWNVMEGVILCWNELVPEAPFPHFLGKIKK